MATDLAQIAYEASQRALDKQERVLDELRSRTSILLAAASLAISFLGRPAVDTSVSAVALVAVLSFTVTIGASVYVLLPKSTFFFAVSGTAVLEELYEFRDDVSEVRRRLVYDMQRFWEINDRAMQRLFLAFRLAAVGLVVEVVLLLATVSDTVF
jgi:hypothetical protein